MKPLYARPIKDEERKALQQGLKSSNGITMRRAQMLLLSADENWKVDAIGQWVGYQGSVQDTCNFRTFQEKHSK